MTALSFTVIGLPAPQGSKRHVGNGVMVESSKKVKPWRQDVVAAALAAMEDWEPMIGPVCLAVDFYLPRPRYHFRTGKRANELKPNAPAYVDKKPDLDKLVRSTCDALTTAGVFRDDSQVATSHIFKRYAFGPGATLDTPGAVVNVYPMNGEAS